MQKINIFAYICTVKSTDLIIDRINEIGEGIVFTYSDLSFTELNYTAVIR